MKIIDLSKPIIENKNDHFTMKVKIKHKSHKIGSFLVRIFGLSKKMFPDKFEGWADDTIKKMGVHSVTHIDAPWHYGPTVNGKKARTIDELPLEWFYGDGVVIDMTHKKDMEIIYKKDLIEAINKTHVHITNETIVLIKTGRDKYIGTKEYMNMGTGVSAEATEWLIDQGVKVMGIDQWGWDLPLKKQIKQIKKGKSKEIFWEGHLVGREKEYCHIEQITGLNQLPNDGFKIMAMPLPLVGCSASPIRLIAIFE